jgi:hypothetical protein
MTGILNEFFGDQQPPARLSIPSYFDAFGLCENPFPPNRKIIAEVLYGQDEAFEQFKIRVRNVFVDGKEPRLRALGLVAGTGGGKTHFLRHCEYKFRELSRALGRPFAIVEYSAGSMSVLELVQDIYRQCDEVCREQGAEDFLSALVSALWNEGEREAERLLGQVAIDDVKAAVSALRRALRDIQGAEGDTEEKANKYYELCRESFRRWMHGDALTAVEKRLLGVMGRVGSATAAVRVLSHLLALGQRLNVLGGVLLCLDELEALFARGARFAQVQAFLEDLRHLYDEASRERQNYSLLIVSTCSSTGATELLNTNFPVFQRLGFVESERVQLRRIQGVVESINFAHQYIIYFHGRWKDLNPGRQPQREPRSLLSNADIEAAFNDASDRSGSSPQGALLDALHRKVEEQRRKSEAPA